MDRKTPPKVNNETASAVVIREQNGAVFVHGGQNANEWIQYDGPWAHDLDQMR